MGIVRKFLSPDEFSNSSVRYDEGTDTIQFTPDGGTTWVDAPQLDPRHEDIFRLPPLVTDAACRASVGMTNVIRAAVNQRLDDIAAIEFAGGLLGIVTFIPGFNVLYALVLAFAAFAFTIGREVLEAAFTEEVYDQIQCIFYCFVDENGQMSAAQFAGAYAALAALDTIPRTWVQAQMDLLGEVGLSDAGVALEAAGDCDECGCQQCYHWDFAAADGDFIPGYPDFAPPAAYVSDWIDGEGWKPSGTPAIYNGFYRDFDPIEITDLLVHWSGGDESMGACGNISAEIYLAGVQQAVVSTSQSWQTTGTLHIAGSYEADRIIISGNNCPTTSWVFDYAEVFFNGSPVFGADNCP